MDRADPSDPLRRRPYPLIVALCAGGFLMRLSFEMMRTPVTPMFAKHLGTPDAYVGLLVAAVTITGILLKFPAGALSDRIGYRKLMTVASAIECGSPLLYLLVVTWPFLLVVRLFHGIATATFSPPAVALVARLYPKDRGYRIGLYNSAETAGTVLGPVVGGAILAADNGGFSFAFVMSAVIGVMALISINAVSEPTFVTSAREISPPASVFTGLLAFLTSRQMIMASLVEAVLWMAIGTVQAYLPLFALTLGMPIWQIGFLAGAQGLASIISRPAMGHHSDRQRSRTIHIAGGLLVSIACIAAIPYAHTFVQLLALSVTFGIGSGTVTPATTALIGDLVTKDNFGHAMGAFGSLWDIGHAIGPIFFGLALAALDYRGAWITVAAIMSATLCLFMVQAMLFPPPARV